MEDAYVIKKTKIEFKDFIIIFFILFCTYQGCVIGDLEKIDKWRYESMENRIKDKEWQIEILRERISELQKTLN